MGIKNGYQFTVNRYIDLSGFVFSLNTFSYLIYDSSFTLITSVVDMTLLFITPFQFLVHISTSITKRYSKVCQEIAAESLKDFVKIVR